MSPKPEVLFFTGFLYIMFHPVVLSQDSHTLEDITVQPITHKGSGKLHPKTYFHSTVLVYSVSYFATLYFATLCTTTVTYNILIAKVSKYQSLAQKKKNSEKY